MKDYINDPQREAEILKLIEGVVNTPARWEYYPNSYDRYKCPFCFEDCSDNEKDPMRVIEHDPDCIYLVAKSLSTNLI